MDNFDATTDAANAVVRDLLDAGILADDVADAMVTQGLADPGKGERMPDLRAA